MGILQQLRVPRLPRELSFPSMAHEVSLPQRHRQNADGPFYVVNGECISCGAPEMHAPTLMSHDTHGHCFFARQPTSADETNEAIKSTWASCCGALRYSGTHRETLIRLAELGLAQQCDFRLKDEPEPLKICRVNFEFRKSETASSEANDLRQISEYLARFLEKPGRCNGRTHSLRFSGPSASFVHQWGDSVHPGGYHATFVVEARSSQRGGWAIRISRNDGHPLLGFAISIHEALEQDARFCKIQWFTDEEWKHGKTGRSLPY
jgi:hypothetical protein